VIDAEDRVFRERRPRDAVEFAADARSRPNGFSTITRALSVRPAA